ncbi:MAG: ATP-binding region ATPase domain protein, partial [Bradyrhizobium sp.]|nr:ATP-binding region ATPase domain protein [Bradyrhizobium sp.]
CGVSPVIDIEVADGNIIISDNGQGIAAETVKKILDYTVRTSDKEAYVSPTRGAQGNALKTIRAMAFALDRASGETVIEAHGIKHTITFAIDPVRRSPRVAHTQDASLVKTGPRVTVRWPSCACSELEAAKARFLQIAEDFTLLNPHLTLRAVWNGQPELSIKTGQPDWEKWSPTDPIPAHWYDADRFERLIAATIAHDQDTGSNMLVREFVGTFRGLSGTGKQKALLDKFGAARLSLADFFAEGQNRSGIAELLGEMQKMSKPVKPLDLGVIGSANLAQRFVAAGADPASFNYCKQFGVTDGLPWATEVAFALRHDAKVRRLTTGVNFSPGITNPFRSLGGVGQSLDTILANQRANGGPVMMLIHLTCPRLSFTDRGKSALALGSRNVGRDDEDDE